MSDDKKIAGFSESQVDAMVEKAALAAGLTVSEDRAKEIAHEEENLIKIFEAQGKLVTPGNLDNLSIGFAKIAAPMIGAKAPDEAYVRRVIIQYTAKAIAAERGDDLGLNFIDNAVIPNSERAQKVYRDYLKGVVAEQEMAKQTPDRSAAFASFNNAHPSDHGGSRTHFQDKAHDHGKEVGGLAV